jgi:alkylated DNA repair dioxygenase AlkB
LFDLLYKKNPVIAVKRGLGISKYLCCYFTADNGLVNNSPDRRNINVGSNQVANNTYKLQVFSQGTSIMQQLTLLPESTPALPVTYYPNFLSTEKANALYQHCLQLHWQQNQIRMLGKTLSVPRLERIYGDKGCNYLYSKSVLLKPLTWTEKLSNLRDRITALTGYKFNIVIGNQYRTGTDSIRWHADNESSTGLSPAIASLSLGCVRKFQIKPIGGSPTDFWLEHGSLLVMHPGCQFTHLHQIPKTNKVVSTRINLTFRPHVGRILRIDSESVSDPNHPAFGCISHLNEILTQYDLVIASPSLETGVSIDIKGQNANSNSVSVTDNNVLHTQSSDTTQDIPQDLDEVAVVTESADKGWKGLKLQIRQGLEGAGRFLSTVSH